VQLIPNKNVGGSGFARGLVEAKKIPIPIFIYG